MIHEIRHGDTLDELRKVETGSVDAVLMDPPYCSGGAQEAQRTVAPRQGPVTAEGGWFDCDNMTTSALVWLLRGVAAESLRVMRPSGHFLVFMDWRMIPSLVPALETVGLISKSLIVWDKLNFGMGLGFMPTHEMIAHFTGKEPTYHDHRLGNVLRRRRVPPARKLHPTEKPLDLLCDLISVTTPPGGLVLDPFAGSGSTVAAAKMLGRSAIGIERDAAFVEKARARIA